jgi:outer membrane lipoprotein-sorting protein
MPVLMFTVPGRADDLKTADEVIEKYIEAIGGRAKIEAMKTIRMTGKMIQQGGMEFPSIMEAKRPEKVRIEFTVQGMTGIQAFDGKEGWSVMPFTGKLDPEKMAPDMVEIIKDQADIDGPLFDYKKKGHQVELMGSDEIEGAPVYKLKVTKKNGDVEYHFIEKENFLTIAQKGKRKFQGMEVEFEAIMGDFKDVEGRVLPHSVQNKSNMGTQTVKFDKIEINPTIDDSRFAMPAVEKKEPEKEKKEEGEKK